MTETSESPGEFVTTERLDDVLVVRIDDGKANALSSIMIAKIKAAIMAAENDEDLAAVLLVGREGKFSAGFDLSVMQAGVTADIVDLVADGGDLVKTIYGASIPVVAACTGHAIAAGAMLLSACDIRVAADGPFKIGLNEVAIGMTLPAWALAITKERVSKRHLQRVIANARLTTPAEAIDIGFVDKVVSPDELFEVALAEAAALKQLDRGAYRRTMSSLRGDLVAEMAAQIESDRANAIAV